MDKETGEPLLVNEQPVTTESEFTPTSSEGSVELTYTFDGSALAGKSVVVFEDLYQGENVVASHADINDEGQTVNFGKPSIGTTATIDGEKTAQPAKQITITDTVEYSGLTAGQEYTLKGVLMDKETGEPLLLNDQQVTSEATFTPAEPNGTIDVLRPEDWHYRHRGRPAHGSSLRGSHHSRRGFLLRFDSRRNLLHFRYPYG